MVWTVLATTGVVAGIFWFTMALIVAGTLLSRRFRERGLDGRLRRFDGRRERDS